MKDWYSVFCSHHSDAISSFKEQLQNNKKLQSLIRVSDPDPFFFRTVRPVVVFCTHRENTLALSK